MFGFIKKNNEKQESNLKLVNIFLNDVEEAYDLVISNFGFLDDFVFVYLQKETNGIKVVIKSEWSSITEDCIEFQTDCNKAFIEWTIGSESSVYFYKFYPFDFYGTWEKFLDLFWTETKSKHGDWTISRNKLIIEKD